MKEFLVKLQISLVIVVVAMLLNFVIESIVDLFGLNIQLKHLLGGGVFMFLAVSLILKLNVWKQ